MKNRNIGTIDQALKPYYDRLHRDDLRRVYEEAILYHFFSMRGVAM